MKSYKNLLGQIERLQRLAAKRRRTELGRVIADIQKKMTDYGITVEELQKSVGTRVATKTSNKAIKGRPPGTKTAAAKQPAKRKVAPKYRDPQTGATWSGRGLTPKWLAERERAGAKRDEFLINAAPKHAAKVKARR